MSALEADVAFDFTFPSPRPPSALIWLFTVDGAFTLTRRIVHLLGRVDCRLYARLCLHALDHSSARKPPVVRHGPLLLPKIRPQDQNLDGSQLPVANVNARRAKKAQTTPPPRPRPASAKPLRSSHARSYTNPETLSSMAYAHMSSFAGASFHGSDPAPLLCSPAAFAQDTILSSEPDLMNPGVSSELPSRRASTSFSVDAAVIDRYGYPTYRRMPFSSVPPTSNMTSQADCAFSSYTPRAPSPLAIAASLDEASTPSTPSTTLINFLTASNPAASLVRNISFPLRDPSIRHFWWDVRNVRSWTSFTASAVLSLPGARALLTTPVPALSSPAEHVG
ncbi:hypothetical protein ACCO45_003049 [Purpureocillium lilacinum]|uniref:Uncharacterized protein n=1 Tax=Purpureocillium lilacinum TaxID=33203 RepID=A0ACC4E1J4_PURLI